MRPLVRVEARAAGRGQNHRRRIHLVEPVTLPGGYVALRQALCGAWPEHGFARADYPRPPERDCPRCYAKVRADDEVENPLNRG